ncbi:MAG TPA: hypothetical protein VFT74_20855 [Isosphaeraceae bacterium]|nr:hypothetical protein [Isosphaeraceae bacterium]
MATIRIKMWGKLMKRIVFVLAVLSLAALTTSSAYAQRGMSRRGRGMVFTVDGPVSTNSPEYRMAGGNMQVYQQLMMQKQMQMQQQAYMKQMQQYQQQMQQQQKQLAELKKKDPAAYAKLEQQYQAQVQAYQDQMKHFMPRGRTVAKKPTTRKKSSSTSDKKETASAEIKPLEPAAAADKAKAKTDDKK